MTDKKIGSLARYLMPLAHAAGCCALLLLGACAGFQGEGKNSQGEAVFASMENAPPLYADSPDDPSTQPLLKRALSIFRPNPRVVRTPDMGRAMTPEQLRNLAGSSSAYRMGAGDVLDIDISGVWQQPDIRTQTALNADGILDIGKLGAYRLQGLTVAQAQRVLRTALEHPNASPNVALRIDQYRSQAVRLQGEVYSPGDYFIDNQAMSLAEAITRAGGLLDRADLSRIELQRAGQKQNLDLRQLYDLGLPPESLLLRAGDVLTFVPKP